MAVLDEAVVLNNGALMPKLGLTIASKDQMVQALRLGYRLFDLSLAPAASFPQLALPQSNIRQQVCLQFTIPSTWTNAEIAPKLSEILRQAKATHFDLVILEAKEEQAANEKAWQVLVHLHEQGRIKNIGLKDFYRDALQDLLSKTRMRPVLEEMNTVDPQLADFLRQQHIRLEQNLHLPNDKGLSQIAQTHHVNPEEVALAFALRRGKIILLTEKNEVQAAAQLNLHLSAEEQGQLERIFQE